AFSATMMMYVIAVVIWSCAEIFAMPIAVILTGKLAPKNLLGRYQGVNSTTNPLASLIGPIFGGLCLQTFGSQMFWLICAGILLCGMMLRLINAPQIDRQIAQRNS